MPHRYQIHGADTAPFWQQADEPDAHWEISMSRKEQGAFRNAFDEADRMESQKVRARLKSFRMRWNEGDDVIFEDARGAFLRITITRIALSPTGFIVYWNPDDAERGIMK